MDRTGRLWSSMLPNPLCPRGTCPDRWSVPFLSAPALFQGLPCLGYLKTAAGACAPVHALPLPGADKKKWPVTGILY